MTAAQQSPATSNPTQPLNVIVATDCGSTTTKAILIEKVGNEYRQTYRGEAPTTVEAPFEDVTRGVLNAIAEIEELSGRTILDGDRIITPNQAAQGDPKRGVDIYVSTSSAGGGLQMMVTGVVQNMTGESAQRAALGAGAEQLDRRIGPGRIDLVPLGDLALRGRFPELLQFLDGGLLEEGILRVDDDSQRVEGDRHFDVLDAGGLAVFHFLGRDRARGISNIDLVATELLEAATSAGDADGNLDDVFLGFLEIFGNRLGNRIDRRGAIDLDDLGVSGACGQKGQAQNGSNIGFLQHGFHS